MSSQTDRFRQLSTGEQSALLRLWAQDGPRAVYRTIYPLFLPGRDPLGGTTRQYNSVTAGTFWGRRSLMQQYG